MKPFVYLFEQAPNEGVRQLTACELHLYTPMVTELLVVQVDCDLQLTLGSKTPYSVRNQAHETQRNPVNLHSALSSAARSCRREPRDAEFERVRAVECG